MLKIDRDIARLFILGKQGLWPGRRLQGLEGTEQAMRQMEYLQLDPLQVIARSQDIALHSRVLDYKPEMWQELAYQQRKFFDWGGWLAVRPMDELPYWRTVMSRELDNVSRLVEIARDHPDAIVEMREILQERDMVSNRDFKKSARKKTQNYRGSKDSSLALYYLWRSGEVMTHHRENFERVYALTESISPADLIYNRDEDEVDRFLIKKEISFSGLSRLKRTSDSFRRGVMFPKKEELCESLLADDEIIEVQIEGWRMVHYALSGDVEILDDLSAGRIPEAWTPVESNTTEEVVFLSPLDPVSARGRAKKIFGFDYTWEVYKPAAKRQYGYYALPILWGDQLVGRFDSKLDRTSNTFVILGLWLEDDSLATDEAFKDALASGFSQFVTFLGADNLNANAISEPLLRKRISTIGGPNSA